MDRLTHALAPWESCRDLSNLSSCFFSKRRGHSYGYDLTGALQEHALTDAKIERAALYRTLRQLERNGNVVSEWDVETGGPARRVYRLTPNGEKHLDEWAAVLQHVSRSMTRFVRTAHTLRKGRPARAPKAS